MQLESFSVTGEYSLTLMRQGCKDSKSSLESTILLKGKFNPHLQLHYKNTKFYQVFVNKTCRFFREWNNVHFDNSSEEHYGQNDY